VNKPSAVAQLLHEYANYVRDTFHAAWEAEPDLAHTLEEQEDHEQWSREQRAKTAVPDRPPWLKQAKARADARKKIEEDTRRKNGNLHDEAHKACKECKRKRALCSLHYWKYIGVRRLVKCLEGTTCLVKNCPYCQEHATG